MEDMHQLLTAIRTFRAGKSQANGGYELGEAALLMDISASLEQGLAAMNGEQRGRCYIKVVTLAKHYIKDYIPTHIPEPRWALASV
ncbi:MAG TPA: hypothetical protein VFT59_05965 [Candidatus Saccharimonadales bacterium]|nr:hypothetical protein [Candidatus Saccharimonadales bacterium]